MHSRLPIKCKYNGCTFEQMPSKKKALTDHEKDCNHRTILCINTNCNMELPLSGLFEHLNQKHNAGSEFKRKISQGDLTIEPVNFKKSYWHSWRTTRFTVGEKQLEFTLCGSI